MKANINDLKVVRWIPKFYNSTDAYHLRTEVHNKDGWRDVVKPGITSTQRLGDLYYDEDNDVVTYVIIDKSELEIEEELRESIRSVYQVPHEFEGNETYQEFRVDLIRSLQKGDIDQDELFEIEDLLEPIYSRVKNGNWKTALFVLNQTDIVDPLLIRYKKKALDVVETYIDNNY